MSIDRVIGQYDTLHRATLPIARRSVHVNPITQILTFLLDYDDTEAQEKRDILNAIKEKLSTIYRPDNEDHSVSHEAYHSTIEFLDRTYSTLRAGPIPRFNRTFEAGVDLCWRRGSRKVVVRVPYEGGAPKLYMKKGDGESFVSETVPLPDELQRDIEWVADE